MSLSLHSGIGAPTKVVVRGTGHVGRAALACVLDHPRLELAGVSVHSSAKAGLCSSLEDTPVNTGLGAMASLVR